MYSLDVIVQGYPGKAVHHGGLGWSTVSLLRGREEVILIDTGSYGYRDPLLKGLRRLGLGREDITSVVITHCHWDHLCNYPLFPRAKIFVPQEDLDWASNQPVGTWHIPEFHVEKLGRDARVVRIQDGDEFLPGLQAIATPGHTPGHCAFVARGEEAELIFAGDAAKNQAELLSGEVDMTLDADASGRSITRLQRLAAENPANVLICGHDRLLSLQEGKAAHRSSLKAAIAARLSAEFNEESTFDLSHSTSDI